MVQEIEIQGNDLFPGNHLPALLYKGTLDIPLSFPATQISQLFEKYGWSNSWDAGIFKSWASIPDRRPSNWAAMTAPN